MGGGAISPLIGTSRGLAEASNLVDEDANHSFYGGPFKPYPSSNYTFHDQTCTRSLGSMCMIEEMSSRGKGSGPDSVFGPVPTRMEIENALSDLQRFMLGLPEPESDLKKLELVDNRYESRMVKSAGFGRVCDAFAMLRTEPSVQKMVLSLSCDEAVWEAILKNEAVQNLQGSLSAAKEEERPRYKEDCSIVELVMKWLMGITKSKICELFDMFGLLITEMLQPTEKQHPTSELDDLLEEKVRSSVLLSVMILVIVVVTRNHGS